MKTKATTTDNQSIHSANCAK